MTQRILLKSLEITSDHSRQCRPTHILKSDELSEIRKKKKNDKYRSVMEKSLSR